MTASFILAFVGIISFLSLRNNFFGLKLLAGMSWFALFIYLKDTPPALITEGSAAHTALLVITIGFGVMIVLAGLGRGIQRTKRWDNGEEISSSFQFSLPSWMKFDNEQEVKRVNREKQLENYEERLDRALHPRNYIGRKR